ncbi:MAG: hypothetical protein LBF21_01755 [Puniceicoccales bacterium]|jgi:hypothetical protein|nr:hypothetical protein [Puniceicoccales bacterium]
MARSVCGFRFLRNRRPAPRAAQEGEKKEFFLAFLESRPEKSQQKSSCSVKNSYSTENQPASQKAKRPAISQPFGNKAGQKKPTKRLASQPGGRPKTKQLAIQQKKASEPAKSRASSKKAGQPTSQTKEKPIQPTTSPAKS